MCLSEVLDMRWRARNEILRLLALPAIRIRFLLSGVTWGRGWRIFGMPIIQRHSGSQILLGDGLELRSWKRSNPLVPNHAVVFATRTAEAVIRVGDHCGFTGATLVAVKRIEIGNRVLLGANVTIADTDFHPLDPHERVKNPGAGKNQPVKVEDDAFVGMNTVILKGVTIGHGAVIGANSVVTANVPAGVVAAGNPARVIRPVNVEQTPHDNPTPVIDK
jgi:acetyltransferase-like isoleucine patch superfamily enzyme